VSLAIQEAESSEGDVREFLRSLRRTGPRRRWPGRRAQRLRRYSNSSDSHREGDLAELPRVIVSGSVPAVYRAEEDSAIWYLPESMGVKTLRASGVRDPAPAFLSSGPCVPDLSVAEIPVFPGLPTDWD
jgi:hypothetical protein